MDGGPHLKFTDIVQSSIQKNDDLMSSLNFQVHHDTLYYADGRI